MAAVLMEGGEGVDYAIDGIGGDTLHKTLGAVKPFGMAASIGHCGGRRSIIGRRSLCSETLLLG
jgi:NADPH:quinone reductase-like Zn-dependent oxidoreductase